MCASAHEQADNDADAVLLDSYKKSGRQPKEVDVRELLSGAAEGAQQKHFLGQPPCAATAKPGIPAEERNKFSGPFACRDRKLAIYGIYLPVSSERKGNGRPFPTSLRGNGRHWTSLDYIGYRGGFP